MTTRYIPSDDNHRQKKLKWMNGICHYHDIFCKCPNPLECTIRLIIDQEPELRFNNIEKDKLRKCITTEEKDTENGDPDDIGEGDLDALFKEDFGDEDTG